MGRKRKPSIILGSAFLLLVLFFPACERDPPATENLDARNRSITFAGHEIDLIRFELPDSGNEFFVSKYEITNSQYKEFLLRSGYDGSDHPSSKEQEPFFHNWKKDPRWLDHLDGNFPTGQANFPACYLNWWHAKRFCQWLSNETGEKVRLPTKAEWMFVAAGTENRKYPWGNNWEARRCNSGGIADGYEGGAPVGSFPNGATPEGVHDLAGNIWEWCDDQVLRGGPWCLGPNELTTSFAGKENPDQANDKFGFRIVVEGRK